MATTSVESTFGSLVRSVTLAPAEVAFYKDQGFLPLPGLVDGAQVAALREEILDVLEANGVSRASLAKASTKADKLRQCTQYLAGSRIDALINSPQMLALAAQLIGGKAVRYMPFTAVKAAGGGGQFDFHQDNNYTQHDPAVGSINIWVALVDMTPDNGCLMVIPGSHKKGQLASRNSDDGDTHQKLDVNPDECFPVRMRAGDAVAFTRWTVHGSGANCTDQPRVAYALQYHREDVNYFNKETKVWEKLIDHPRWSTGPVAKLGPQ